MFNNGRLTMREALMAAFDGYKRRGGDKRLWLFPSGTAWIESDIEGGIWNRLQNYIHAAYMDVLDDVEYFHRTRDEWVKEHFEDAVLDRNLKQYAFQIKVDDRSVVVGHKAKYVKILSVTDGHKAKTEDLVTNLRLFVNTRK